MLGTMFGLLMALLWLYVAVNLFHRFVEQDRDEYSKGDDNQ